MAITITWSSEVQVNGNERRQSGTWYDDGVEQGTIEAAVDENNIRIESDAYLIKILELQQ